MTGETNLHKLLRSMRPELHTGEYVFCTFETVDQPTGIEAVGWFHEQEGWTAILARPRADELALPYSFVSAWITLTVHSALDAVGLTAAVSQALAGAGISCNVVAAYYHDHLFVPANDGQRAVAILENLAVNGNTVS